MNSEWLFLSLDDSSDWLILFTAYDLLSHSPAPGPAFPVDVRMLNSRKDLSLHTGGHRLGSWLPRALTNGPAVLLYEEAEGH